jgi:hypothetical protein
MKPTAVVRRIGAANVAQPPGPPTPDVILHTRPEIGCRWTGRHTVRYDSETGVFEEQCPGIDVGLQDALLRAKPLKFFDPIPGTWRELRAPPRAIAQEKE